LWLVDRCKFNGFNTFALAVTMPVTTDNVITLITNNVIVPELTPVYLLKVTVRVSLGV